MLTRMPAVRSSGSFLVVLLAAGLVASTTESFAQPPPRGQDRPVQRTLPRKEIYGNLSKELGVTEGEVKALEQSTEDKGFPPRETVVLLLLAKARADRLIEEGKFSKRQGMDALNASVDFLVGLIEKDKAGWLALVQNSGGKADLSAVVAKANQIIGFHSERAGVSRTVPVMQREVAVKAEGESEKVKVQPPAKAAAQEGREGVRSGANEGELSLKKKGEPEPAPAKMFPREVILQNLAKEFSLDVEMINAHLTRYEQEMPIREAVLVFVIANDLTRRQILTGEIDKAQRKQAFESNLNYILQRRHEGVGWGDIGRLGELSGRDVNLKANRLVGQ
jgi:hypothetical protein